MLRTALWLCAFLGLLSACCRQQPKEDTLDILFTGDVLLDRSVRPWIELSRTFLKALGFLPRSF